MILSRMSQSERSDSTMSNFRAEERRASGSGCLLRTLFNFVSKSSQLFHAKTSPSADDLTTSGAQPTLSLIKTLLPDANASLTANPHVSLVDGSVNTSARR